MSAVGRLVGIALGLVAGIVRMLPESARAGVCRVVADFARFVWPNRRRIAEENLRRAFPAGPPTDAKAVFRHLARAGWDFVRLARHARHDFAAVHIDPVLSSLLDRTTAPGRGLVVASGHLGSWELMSAALARRVPVPVHLVVKPVGVADRWVQRARERAGLRTIVARSPWAVGRAVRDALAQGHVVAFVIDQHAPTGACIFPLFDQPAATTRTPARMAMRASTPLVWVDSRTVGDHHEVQGTLVYAGASDSPTDDVALTADLNGRLERAVRSQPDQWIWTHRRWKVDRPKDASSPRDEVLVESG